jgi:SPX domain protein involved in polyphosphate accumulation
MVEFGLKLIDNRVSEWKDNYIDYETLQVLLKKAVEAKEKLKDLKARDPEAAQSIAATDDEEDTEKREESSRIEIAA